MNPETDDRRVAILNGAECTVFLMDSEGREIKVSGALDAVSVSMERLGFSIVDATVSAASLLDRFREALEALEAPGALEAILPSEPVVFDVDRWSDVGLYGQRRTIAEVDLQTGEETGRAPRYVEGSRDVRRGLLARRERRGYSRADEERPCPFTPTSERT